MKNKKVLIPLILVVLIAFGSVGFYSAYIYNSVKAWNNIIYPGIKIEGIDLSGKTKEQAAQMLKENYSDVIPNKKVNIKALKRTYTLNYSKLIPKYNVDEVVNQALNYGKNVSFFSKYNLIKRSSMKNFKLSFTYDSKPVKDIVSTIEKDVNKDPVNASIKLVGSSFQINPEVKGVKLLSDKLEKDILNNINGDLGPDVNIEAATEEVQPKVTSDKLKTIDSAISTFSTNYGSISPAERANNIALATRGIDGTVLMPGDSFSFNGVLGKRTAEKGYKSAHVIVGTQVVDDFGGGICQVSTTLYNTVLRANVTATERSHHTLPSAYIGLGMDATVDYGNLDYKFTNTLSYPMYIAGRADGTNVSFIVYSNSSLKGRTYDIYNDVYETIQPNVKYIDDPTMPIGQTETIQKPFTGYRVRVYKKTIQNGNVISTDLISNDYYKPVDAQIKRGTKK
ncbi:MAG: VanW family protein [Clostridiaceae bacterium]|nr:VanW family protein [Clostridiaceae bacterium]